MIELISDERCIKCDICVRVCPTNVFDAVPNQRPVIARQEDCQTCFMCELYCPTDAMFVAPDVAQHTPVDEEELIRNGLLGSYRRSIGWAKGTRDVRADDPSFELLRAVNT